MSRRCRDGSVTYQLNHLCASDDDQPLYTLTESAEPPISLNEAAAIGKIDLVKSLIANGADVNTKQKNVKLKTENHNLKRKTFEFYALVLHFKL